MDYLIARNYTHETEPRTTPQPSDVCMLCLKLDHETADCPRWVEIGGEQARPTVARTSSVDDREYSPDGAGGSPYGTSYVDLIPV